MATLELSCPLTCPDYILSQILHVLFFIHKITLVFQTIITYIAIIIIRAWDIPFGTRKGLKLRLCSVFSFLFELSKIAFC